MKKEVADSKNNLTRKFLSSRKGKKGEVYITANPQTYLSNKRFQNKMKNNPTKAEDALWQQIRNKKLGFKFRRQHIIDDYIVDFVCLSKQLVIEVDGKIHDSQKEYDQARTSELKALGYKVIRFRNEEILYDINLVIERIKAQLYSINETVTKI